MLVRSTHARTVSRVLHIFANRGHLILRSVDSKFYEAWTPIFVETWTLFEFGKILN